MGTVRLRAHGQISGLYRQIRLAACLKLMVVAMVFEVEPVKSKVGVLNCNPCVLISKVEALSLKVEALSFDVEALSFNVEALRFKVRVLNFNSAVLIFNSDPLKFMIEPLKLVSNPINLDSQAKKIRSPR